jgi:hypothetical protein
MNDVEEFLRVDEKGRLLPEGTRIRSVEHPELTGVIKHYEWNRAPGDKEYPAGRLSGIPYCIGWDDDQAAHEKLGMLFVYATVNGVEVEPLDVT